MLKRIQYITAAQSALRYIKCVKSGGSWVGCMVEQVTRKVKISDPEGGSFSVDELFEYLPEEQRLQILTDIFCAQDDYLKQCKLEIEELGFRL